MYIYTETCRLRSSYWLFHPSEIKIIEDAGFEAYSEGRIYKHKTKHVYIFVSEFNHDEKTFLADGMPNYIHVNKIPIKLISSVQIKILAESIDNKVVAA